MALRILIAAITALAVIGCTASVPPSGTPVPSGFIALPTLPGIAPDTGGVPFACAGVGFSDSVLHGSQAATDKVWLEMLEPSAWLRVAPVRWPAGFRGRFAPTIEILDPSGTVVAREGDVLTTIGGIPGSDGRFAIWSFDGKSYPCY